MFRCVSFSYYLSLINNYLSLINNYLSVIINYLSVIIRKDTHIKNTFKSLFTYRRAPFQIRKVRIQASTVVVITTSELPTHLQIKATHSGRIDLLMTRRDMITVRVMGEGGTKNQHKPTRKVGTSKETAV